MELRTGHEPGATSVPYVHALTGLRFVAAAVVLIEHFPQIVPGVSGPRLAQGGAGVSLFFVLSGFVLTINYGDRFAQSRSGRQADVRDYLVKRFARLFPLHLVALAVLAVMALVRDDIVAVYGPIRTAVSLVANTLLVQVWFPSQLADLWNAPSWSIGAELFFYLLFPLLIPLVVWPLRRRRRLGAAIVVVLVAEVIAFIALAWLVGSVLLSRGTDAESARLILVRLARLPPIRLGEFLAGCLLAALYLGRADAEEHVLNRVLGRPRNRTALLIGAAMAFAAVQWTPQYLDGSIDSPTRVASTVWSMIDLRIFASYLPISVVAVAAVAWGDSPIARALRSSTMIRLGEASYALYILQWIPWRIVNDPAVGPPGPWLAALAILGCLVAALVASELIEKPARRWIVRRYAPAGNRAKTDVADVTDVGVENPG